MLPTISFQLFYNYPGKKFKRLFSLSFFHFEIDKICENNKFDIKLEEHTVGTKNNMT